MSNRVRYTRQNIINNSFYQLPKFLFDVEFTNLTNDARVLYAILRNRHEISIKNGWYDDNGEVFLYFKREDMQDILNLSGKTVTKAMNDLKSFKLLEEARQGISKPNKIYLLSALVEAFGIETAETLENTMTRKNYVSRPVNFTHQETEILRPNHNNIIHNNINNPVMSSQSEKEDRRDKTDALTEYTEIIKSNIEYKTFLDPQEKALVDEMIAIMLDAITTKGEYITLNGEKKNREQVKIQLLKLRNEHITHVIDTYKGLESPITKKKQYILTMLYNTSMEYEAHYTHY